MWGREELTYPVLQINILAGLPLPRHKCMLVADNLRLEEGGELRVLFCESLDHEVPAEVGVLQVHVLQESTSV